MVMALDNTHIFFWLKIEEEEGCFCKKCKAGKFFPKEPMTEIRCCLCFNFRMSYQLQYFLSKKKTFVCPSSDMVPSFPQ